MINFSVAGKKDVCYEDPQKSIQLEMGEVKDIFKCTFGKKEEVTKEKCVNFNEPIHNSVCRYDCSANAKGCEEGYKGCKIIIYGGKDSQPAATIAEDNDVKLIPGKGTIIFTNKEKGSIVRAFEGESGTGSWIHDSRLKDEKGKCCRCEKEDDMGKNQATELKKP